MLAIHAQPAAAEAFEQTPMPAAMERPAPEWSSLGRSTMTTGIMSDGSVARITFPQPQDEVSPGLRRAVDGAVDEAFDKKGPTAQASSGQPMQPEALVRAMSHLLEVEAGGNINGNTIHLRKASLDPGSLIFNGLCNAKNKANSWIARKISDKAGKLSTDYCYQRDSVFRHAPVDYSPSLDRLGSKAAASAGFDVSTHGDATRIAATAKRAKISFAPQPNTTQTGELKSLTLRKGMTPLKTLYK